MYRDMHGMSMGDFSKLSGISKAYISLLEKNKHPSSGKPIEPTVQTIRLAAKAMGMSEEKLIALMNGESEHREELMTVPAPQEPTLPYYLNEETAKIAQEAYDNPELRLLFDASRNAKPEDIRFAIEMLEKFKRGNPDG